jgi:hypothetical protein
MALTIDFKSAAIKVDTSGAANAVSLGSTPTNKVAICHLTRGASITGSGFNFGPAIRMVGTVDLLLGPGDSQSGWDFNFLQFGNLMVRSALWGGRTPSEGSVAINYAVAPAYKTNPSLDSTTANSPFVGLNASSQDSVPEGSGTRITLTREMGDHPNSRQVLVVPNATTSAKNYLYNMRLDVGFTTAFVARESSGTIHYLAHFTWHLIYDARFVWTGGNCTGTMHNGRLDVGTVTKGKPTDATLQKLLTSPVQPFYNDLCAAANKTVMSTAAVAPNYVESATRDGSIPATFYS